MTKLCHFRVDIVENIGTSMKIGLNRLSRNPLSAPALSHVTMSLFTYNVVAFVYVWSSFESNLRSCSLGLVVLFIFYIIEIKTEIL